MSGRRKFCRKNFCRRKLCIWLLSMSLAAALLPCPCIGHAETAGTGAGGQEAEVSEGKAAGQTETGIALTAPAAILVEASTGKVLFEKNADEVREPASVTKVMTLLLAFEAIDSGKMKLSDIVTVSEHAASMGGSQCFFEPGETQTVEDMIKCIIISSGNDAAVAMGEHIAGSEEAFVKMMNEKAEKLGMKNTVFKNACGLEASGHVTTPRDISLMSRELITVHPDVFQYSTIWMDSIYHVTKRGKSEFGLANTNKFLKYYNGATGLKTGFTSKAMYCISATAKRDNMDLIAVVMGAPSSKERTQDVAKLMDYGFANYHVFHVELDQRSGELVPVKNGKKDTVATRISGDFSYLCQGENTSDIVKKTTYEKKLGAPVQEGTKVGEISFYYNEQQLGSVPVLAAETVEKAGFLDCLMKIIERLLFR